MRILALALLVSLSACDNPFSSSSATLTGRWQGETVSGDVQVDLNLSQGRDGNVQGSGTLAYGTVTPTVQVSGVNDRPYISLTLFSGGSPVLSIEGQFNGNDRWTGSLCGFSGGCQNIEFERL